MSSVLTSSQQLENEEIARAFGFDGLIGVGKTTIATILQEGHPSNVKCFVEVMDQGLLNLFYSDPKKYAFVLQTYAVVRRNATLSIIDAHIQLGCPPSPQCVIWDRTIVGDYVFALTNALDGNIGSSEFATYEQMVGWGYNTINRSALAQMSAFVMFELEPQICKERVEQLRKNPVEKDIPLDYYVKLDDVHFNVFVRRLAVNGIPLMVIDSSDLKTNGKAIDSLYAKFTGGSPMKYAKVTRLLDDTLELPTDATVYSHADDITEAYNLLLQRKLTSPETIYVSEDICCTVFPNSSKIGYDVRRYTNPYKRVVYYHLINGTNVCFF